MLLQLFVNLCILFAFAFFLFWFAENNRFLTRPFIDKYRIWIIGVVAGIFGIVLMHEAIHLKGSILIDARLVVLALSGLFGGPLAALTTGIIMGIGRIAVSDYSLTALIAGVNMMMIGMVIGLVATRYPITFQNVWKFFAYTIIHSGIVISYVKYSQNVNFWQDAIHLLYSVLSFLIVYYILYRLDGLSKEVSKIEHLAVTDYLTGLANAREFQQLFSHWQQAHPSFYLAVADIDFFKRVNDYYGHPVGDLVLQQLAAILEVEVKGLGGVAARIGGEEFAMLLPDDSEEHVMKTLNDIRQVISETDFRISDDAVVAITISMGAAGYPRHTGSLTELYKAADDELYKAKNDGRNCVRVLNGKEISPA